MQLELEALLRQLATEEVSRIRTAYNKQFLACGPGAEFERYKARPDTVARLAQEKLLAEYAGVSPFQ